VSMPMVLTFDGVECVLAPRTMTEDDEDDTGIDTGIKTLAADSLLQQSQPQDSSAASNIPSYVASMLGNLLFGMTIKVRKSSGDGTGLISIFPTSKVNGLHFTFNDPELIMVLDVRLLESVATDASWKPAVVGRGKKGEKFIHTLTFLNS